MNTKDYRDLEYDMNLIGLDINKIEDVKYYIARLEKSIRVAKTLVD